MTLGGSTKADIAPFTHTEFDEFYLTLIYLNQPSSTITSRNCNVPTITPSCGSLIYFERELKSQYNNPTNLSDL